MVKMLVLCNVLSRNIKTTQCQPSLSVITALVWWELEKTVVVVVFL